MVKLDPAQVRERLLKGLRCQRMRDVGLFTGDGESDPDCNSHGEEVTANFVQNIKGMVEDGSLGPKALFMAEDLFIRQQIESLQAMFSQWMARAAAQVDGENIPFKEIIIWCQNCHDWEKRRALRIEARALCRFLAPFSHATWQALMSVVKEILGYEDYLEFCQKRRSTPLEKEYKRCQSILEEGRDQYFSEVESWLKRVYPGKSLEETTRFDAIYLLGMRYLDHLAGGGLRGDLALKFFESLGVGTGRGVQIHMDGTPGRQTYCVPVKVPGEIHVIVGPIRGWLDWEALFHEMGHAFSFLHTDLRRPVEEREFLTSGAVSETIAFLFQRLSLRREFLLYILGPGADGLVGFEELEQIHALKFEVLKRRYGAKFLIEYENFSKERISKGQELYADIMHRETGFSYDPETYLFDLMPDFYSLDYFNAFVASKILLKRLEQNYGPRWFLNPAALDHIRTCLTNESLDDVHGFMKQCLNRIKAH